MKKSGIINSELSRVIASMGHTDRLVICDSGLPIPKNSEVIDLALISNIPRFLDTLKAVLGEFKVEEAILAEELVQDKDGLFEKVSALMNGTKISRVNHERFKELTKAGGNITFVRTGEATPYANIILISGVTFS